MQKISKFYLSEVLNQKVYDEFDDVIGHLKDIYVTTENGYPRVIAYKIRNDRDIFNYEFREVEFYRNKNKIIIKAKEVRDIIPRKFTYLLSLNLLSKKIIDVNGKKVIRVDDLTLVQTQFETKVVAVTSGPLSVARRIGMDKLIKLFYKLINKDVNDNVIMWEDVQSLKMINNNLKLSIPYGKISKLHPADIADILEELEPEDRKRLFDSLDINLAADTLKETEHDVQMNILKNIDNMRMREILDFMPNDKIADMLDEIDENQIERIILNLNEDDEKQVRNLMEYEEETVGSIMNKEFIAFNVNITVEETIDILRETKPDEEVMFNIFLIDDHNKLRGIISLPELVTADKNLKLEQITENELIYVYDNDDIDKAIEYAVKYDMVSIPVVDKEKSLCGIVIINDVFDKVIPTKVRKKFKKAV